MSTAVPSGSVATTRKTRWPGSRFCSLANGGAVDIMHRTIAAAAIVFAFAAFALHSASLGPFEEPLLLLVMGSLFLVVGRLVAPHEDEKTEEEDAEPAHAPVLGEREVRV